jgi:hypothetical protein
MLDELQFTTAVCVELAHQVKALETELAQYRPDARVIRAGELLPHGVLVVVDEATKLAYAHPRTKIIPFKRRIWGYTVAEYQAGEAVGIRDWWMDE